MVYIDLRTNGGTMTAIIPNKVILTYHSVLNIHVPVFLQILALKGDFAGTEVDTLAEATSGVVKSTTFNSSDIVTKILQVQICDRLTVRT